MATASYTASSTTWDEASGRALSLPWTRAKVLVVAMVVALACLFRLSALSTYGFSDDELNKLHAIEQYRAGVFVANAEHPLLMKLTMWGSVAAAEQWNRIASTDLLIPLEAALRFPNAIAGALTALVLFGVADLLFGTGVAMVASLIWAFDVNATAINRIGKEDSFLLLFFLLAVFCYERAKRIGAMDVAKAQPWYTLSGAAFGLMLASKYMPHFIGIYALFNVAADSNPGFNKPNRIRHFAAMGAAFLAANPMILMPATWRYLATYVSGDMLAHHGYLYSGALYVTDVPVSPLGVPMTFYLRLLATKVPLVVLGALVPGVIEMVRRRRERGFVFLRVLAVFLIVPYSLMAPKFLRYSLPMLATVDLIAAVGWVHALGWLLRKQWLRPLTRTAVAIAAVAVFGIGLVVAEQTAAPFYSMFQNSLGARFDRTRSAFPEQTYDYGLRESMAATAAAASPSAVVFSDATSVAAYYLRQYGRPDIVVRSLSSKGLTPGTREAWVAVQDEHLTFENRLVVQQLRATSTPWKQFRIDGAIATQLFRIAGGHECCANW